MRKQQYIWIIGAIILIAAIYFLGNNKPIPAKDKVASSEAAASGHQNHDGHNHAHLNWDSLYKAAENHLAGPNKAEYQKLANDLATASSNEEKVKLHNALAAFWRDHKEPIVVAFHQAEEAKLANSENMLNFAAQFLLDVMSVQEFPENIRHWAADEAIICLTQSQKLNPNNDTVQLALATAYVDGTGETMKGVQELLSITRRDESHIAANLMLGRMAVQSGQLDKAITRMNTVLAQQPNNREAMFFLAEAYKGQGKKQEAVNVLEKLKTIVNDPAFTADIDNYIKSF